MSNIIFVQNSNNYGIRYPKPMKIHDRHTESPLLTQTYLFYVGCESGDNLVLERVNKGENFDSSLAALQKIKAAGAKSSVMILNGMGGQRYSEQHAVNSARLMTAAQPEYLSTLVVSFPTGTERYQKGYGGDFVALDQADLFQEMYWLLDNLELENTIFRSDHASNYLVLKGALGRDKPRLL